MLFDGKVSRGVFCGFQHFLVRGNHAFVHLVAHLCFQFPVAHEPTDEIHLHGGGTLLLWKVVLSMGTEESMVLFHHASHQVDEVPENLHASHSPEVPWLGIAMIQLPDECGCQTVDGCVWVVFVRGYTRQDIASHLCPGLDDVAQILFVAVVAIDEVAEWGSHRDGAMPVTELSVIVHLEPVTHGMVLDAECIDDGIVLMDLFAQQGVKAILVEAFAACGTVEATDATSREGECLDVHLITLKGKNIAETVDHAAQGLVLVATVADNHHPFVCTMLHLSGWFAGQSVRGRRGHCRGLLEVALTDVPQDETEPLLCLVLPLGMEQIVHVCREPFDEADAHISTIVFDEAVGCNVVEMLGGGELRGCLIREVRTALLHQFHKTMQLAGNDEGIDGVAEQKYIAALDGFDGWSEVFLPSLHPLTGSDKLKRAVWKTKLQPKGRLECSGVVALGTSIDDKDIHRLEKKGELPMRMKTKPPQTCFAEGSGSIQWSVLLVLKMSVQCKNHKMDLSNRRTKKRSLPLAMRWGERAGILLPVGKVNGILDDGGNLGKNGLQTGSIEFWRAVVVVDSVLLLLHIGDLGVAVGDDVLA